MNKKEVLFREKDLNEILDFINKEFSFDKMIKNAGIYETGVIARNIEDEFNITIGVTYEDANGCGEPYELEDGTKLEEWYFYNIFAGKEYVSISGDCVGRIDNRVPESVLISIRESISELLGEV